MSDYNESDHPRKTDGKFTTKTNSAPTVKLEECSPVNDALRRHAAAYEIHKAAMNATHAAKADVAVTHLRGAYPDAQSAVFGFSRGWGDDRLQLRRITGEGGAILYSAEVSSDVPEPSREQYLAISGAELQIMQIDPEHVSDHLQSFEWEEDYFEYGLDLAADPPQDRDFVQEIVKNLPPSAKASLKRALEDIS